MICLDMKAICRIIAAWAALISFQAFAQYSNSPAQLAPVNLNGLPLTAIPQFGSSAATVVSGEEVQVGEITSIRDLTAQTPNLSVFDANDQRMPKFSFRGFRENNFGAGEPVVGLYVDDVPYFDMYSRGLSLFDVREIQFVRGEQGTLYGAGGVGGVINVLTVQPQNQSRGYAEASYGNYNAQNYQAGLSGPIVTNKLFFGVNGLITERDGFVYDTILHDHPDTQETLSLRGVLRWTPSDPWSVTLMASAGRDNDGFVPTYEPGLDSSPFNVARKDYGYDRTDNLDETLKIGYDDGSIRVTSVTAHRQWQQTDFQELPPEPPFLGTLSLFDAPRLDQWTEELRVESPDFTAPFKWRAGFYYANGQERNNDFASLDLQSQTLALCGQGTYTLWERLDLTAGARLTYDYRLQQKSGLGYPFTGPFYGVVANSSDEFTSAQPKFAAAWHFTPELEAYASAVEGYQSGGVNPYALSPSMSKFGAERDWQFETGVKSSWLHNKFSANAALFYTIAGDYQTYTGSSMLNAHRADLYGAELEMTAKPVEGLDLSAGAGYTDARYTRFTQADLDGKPISFVPEFTADGRASYRLPWWHLYIRGEIIGVGRYHLDDFNDATSGPVTQNAYCLVNAQLGYESKHFEVHFFAKNIFDTRYYNNASSVGYPTLLLQPGDPGTFGIAATARF